MQKTLKEDKWDHKNMGKNNLTQLVDSQMSIRKVSNRTKPIKCQGLLHSF
jgi:hypothetical protein